MADNMDSAQDSSHKVETRIVFEAPQKSVGQAIIVWLIRSVVSLILLACAAYALLFFTPAGEEMRYKYEKRCRETYQSLSDGIDFCRFYISYFGRAPASSKEVLNFQSKRLTTPFTQYRLQDGRNLPYWNCKDGFGHEIDIQINPQTRTIKLTSPGFIPLSGDMPCIFDYIREDIY